MFIHVQMSKLASRQVHACTYLTHSLIHVCSLHQGAHGPAEAGGGQTLAYSPGSLHSINFYGDSRMELKHHLLSDACPDFSPECLPQAGQVSHTSSDSADALGYPPTL